MKSALRFWKLQSIGNDFPLVHLADVVEVFQGRALDEVLPNLAISICNRRFGVGGDGLLAMDSLARGHLFLRMFNPDGTEDFCGNGLRCAAVHGQSVGWVDSAFHIEHLGRMVPTLIEGATVRTGIGSAFYDPGAVPLSIDSEIFRQNVYWGEGYEIVGSALTTGSTHVVVPVEQLPTDEEIQFFGPRIEHFELFPIRTSVVWAEIVEEDHLKIRIWERGVGETLGCGTGSSAAAADYLRFKGGGGIVRVDNPGGTVFVSMDHWDAPIYINGSAEQLFEGEFCIR